MVQLSTACLAVLIGLASASCQSAPTPRSGALGPSFRGEEVRPDEFTLVFLRTGTHPPSLTESESNAAFEGHFEFMARLAAENTLLFAGPFGNNKATSDLRGLFLIDGDSPASAAAVAREDPTTKLGIFRQEAVPIMVLDTVRHLPAMYAEYEAALVADRPADEPAEGAAEDAADGAAVGPANDTGPVLADYVVMVAMDGKAAFQACTHPAIAPKVVLLGRLGEPMDGALFGVFDAADPKELRARLQVAGLDAEGVALSEWLASPVLRALVTGD